MRANESALNDVDGGSGADSTRTTRNSGQALVLIVDDKPDKTLAIQSIVEELDVGVVVAPSADVALRELLRREFVLALLDVHMPQMDGFELAALIRARPSHQHLPIVFMSSIHQSDERLEQAYTLGAIDFISLPARRLVIKAKLAAMLGRNAASPPGAVWPQSAPASRRAERFRLVLQKAEDVAIFFLDAGGRVVEWTDNAESCTGWSATEVAGQEFSRFFVPGDVARGLPRELLAAARGAHPGMSERWMVRQDGTRFFARFWVVALGDSPDAGFGVLLRDVSCQRHAGKELQIKAKVLEAMAETVLVVNEQLRIVYVNPAGARTFGYDVSQLIGSDVRLLNAYQPDEQAVRTAALLKHLAQHGQWVGEWYNRRKDGSVFLSHTRVSRFQQDDATYFVTVQEDLTDRQEGAAALQRSVELQEIVGELEAFSYSVSHDLKSPLQTLRGLAELVMEDYGDVLKDGGRDYLQRMHRVTERLEKMVEDVLAVSRMARTSIPLVPVALQPRLAGILDDSVGLRLPAADVQVRGDLPTVLGHEVSLRQVFANLLNNAVKFVPRERQARVTIRAEVDGGDATIWIEDNGIGVPPGAEQRIFRAFERSESAADFPGTGVGLAIVKRIVERLGGSVGVRRRETDGSAFWVKLKRVD